MTIRRCPECKSAYLDDVDICPACLTISKTVTEEVAGAGKIYSFTRVHVAPQQFQSLVPYYLAIIELDAGPRLIGRLQTQEGDHVRVDAPVELVSSENGHVFSLK
ncbi:MAG TPA: OB-fold domain-containing protein [Acidobacteriota bacterium]